MTRLLSWGAAAGIGLSLAMMLAICVSGPSRAVAKFRMPAVGPPFGLGVTLPTSVVMPCLWAAAALGGAGVAAGLLALSRGARPRPRLLLAAALVVAAGFTVLPPAGSTDSLDYAAYGRMVVIGRDPYVMTPLQLRSRGDPIGKAAPRAWQKKHSVYGPLATMEEAAAAELGGASPAQVTFWLKLFTTLGFGSVVIGLDRLLRASPARRARAHLWWSLNPLVLWGLVASGHIDALATAAGLAGLLLIRAPLSDRQEATTRAAAAGVLVGVGADLKITMVLYLLGICWAARRHLGMAIAAISGAVAVLLPSYLWFGPPAVYALLNRDASATSDNFYAMFYRLFRFTHPTALTLISLLLLAAVALLLLTRLPDAFPALPAVQPTMAISLAWLLVWPYQRPWYDAIVICLLALYPASRLDWLMLLRLTIVSFFYMPGMPGRPPGWLAIIAREERLWAVPATRFAVLVAVVVLAATGAWRSRATSPFGLARSVPGLASARTQRGQTPGSSWVAIGVAASRGRIGVCLFPYARRWRPCWPRRSPRSPRVPTVTSPSGTGSGPSSSGTAPRSRSAAGTSGP
jgi:hypothetical protein